MAKSYNPEDWLVHGRTYRDLVGRRVLCEVETALDNTRRVELTIHEVSGSNEWFRSVQEPGGYWLCCRHYRIVEVLPHQIPGQRTHAMMWGLLGTDDVGVVKDWLASAYERADEETRAKMRLAMPRLVRNEVGPPSNEGAKGEQP
jgi:hypothetical protein